MYIYIHTIYVYIYILFIHIYINYIYIFIYLFHNCSSISPVFFGCHRCSLSLRRTPPPSWRTLPRRHWKSGARRSKGVVSGELLLILGGRDSYGLILMYPNISPIIPYNSGYWIVHIFCLSHLLRGPAAPSMVTLRSFWNGKILELKMEVLNKFTG